LDPRKEETLGLEKLHNEEINDLYSSSKNIRPIKSRRMGWVERVARMCSQRDIFG